MIIDADSQTLKSLTEGLRAWLAMILRDAYGADQKAATLELVTQSQHVVVIGYAEVGTHFVFLDVAGANGDDHLGIVAQLHEHLELAVGFKTRQHATGMKIVEELASELQIKLVAELGDALLDVFGLNFEILLVVETVFHKKNMSPRLIRIAAEEMVM